MSDDEEFGNWLAGLIDGEGCFRIHSGRSHGRFPYYICRFSLKQRDDDTSMLEEIVRATGIGGVRFDRSRSGNSRPCAVWVAESKADTAALVELLDRYRLRSRKRRDYMIWREAVAHRASEPRGNRWHGQRDWTTMADFKRRIEEARTYAGRG